MRMFPTKDLGSPDLPTPCSPLPLPRGDNVAGSVTLAPSLQSMKKVLQGGNGPWCRPEDKPACVPPPPTYVLGKNNAHPSTPPKYHGHLPESYSVAPCLGVHTVPLSQDLHKSLQRQVGSPEGTEVPERNGRSTHHMSPQLTTQSSPARLPVWGPPGLPWEPIALCSAPSYFPETRHPSNL